jgi:phage terminase large subunit
VYKDTTATKKIFQLKKRIRAVAGGTSASKTISILIWLIDYCQVKQGRAKRCSVVSESYPHLEGGAIFDFKNIMQDKGYWSDSRWNATKHIYTFPTGNELQFFSPDTYGKAHGPRRDVLFVNEANNLAYNIVDQLMTRTREVVFMDWNPTNEFWFYTELKPNRQDIDFITLTYLDNEALDKVTVAEIEAHKHNKNWWKVYGLGQLGEVEGRVFKDWAIIDEVPHHARLVARWLDFGYTNDPTSIGSIYYHDGGYIADEELYQKGMLNKPIADFLSNLADPQTIVVADSAEPKSIAEIKGYGLNIIGVTKRKGESNADNFVKWSIGLVQDQRMSITKRSVNTIKEYRGLMWLTDKDGKILNEEDPKCANHSMAGIRYVMVYKISAPKPGPAIVTPAPQPYYGDREMPF